MSICQTVQTTAHDCCSNYRNLPIAIAFFLFLATLLSTTAASAQAQDCSFFEPDESTWMVEGPTLVNQSDRASAMLSRPDSSCTTDLADVQPGGRVRVLVDQGDFLYVRHIDDNFRNAWLKRSGFVDETDVVDNSALPVDCTFFEPDESIWLTDGPLLRNLSGSATPMLARPDDTCATDLADVQPGGQVRVLVDQGDYLYIRHIDDNFRNAWVDSMAFFQSSDPVSVVSVTGNTISWSDNGWYQVQVVTNDDIVEVCAGTRLCEVPAGNYIVINHTTGERFEDVVVSAVPNVSAITVTGNTISWPDNGWYQVQLNSDAGIVEVCAGTRLCEVPAGNYIVINHTTGERFEDIVVRPRPGVSEISVTGATISWPENGWYQVQAITDDGIEEVCAGTRSCEVPDGSYIVINHTTGERFEPVLVNAGEDQSGPDSVPGVPESEQRIIPTTEARPFLPDGPFAKALSDCAFAGVAITVERICTLSTLPYIGQTTDVITVNDILARTLVTHDWMGERLGNLLAAMPSDLLPLFAPVTTIVIGSEIRPSSFNAAIGRLMIDPDNLWMTVPEKRTVSSENDFRAEFGSQLQFVSYWRLMRGENYALPFSSLLDDSTREFNDTILLSARPLYHELAHANDYIRPENINQFNPELTPLQAANLFPEQRVAELLYADASLTVLSSYLYGLARVRFNDDPPTEIQTTYLADFVGGEMGNEGKQTFYGYFTIQEDVATLFAQTMLRYHFGIETHVAFMNKPEGHPDDANCNDYKVAWGVRNRLASPLVAPRARFVTELLIGQSAELDSFFSSSLGEQTPLREGAGWCDSRFVTPQAAGKRSATKASENGRLAFQQRQLY